MVQTDEAKGVAASAGASLAPRAEAMGRCLPNHHAARLFRSPNARPIFSFIAGVVLGSLSTSCAPTTYKASTYSRTVTTYLEVTSNVPAEVWLGDRVVGMTPVSFPVNYEEEVDRRVTTANYWETNPGTAAALTVLSFGTYLPFSFIPAEPTSQTRPAGKFLNNSVSLRLSAEGHEPLEHVVELKGEPKIVLNLSLKPIAKN